MSEKVKIGRPPKSEDERMIAIPVRFPRAMVSQIEAQPEVTSGADERSAMIRNLVREALEARAKRRKS